MITRLLAIGGFAGALLLFAAVEWRARREGSRIPMLGEVCAYVMRYEVGRVPVGSNWRLRLLVVAGLASLRPLTCPAMREGCATRGNARLTWR